MKKIIVAACCAALMGSVSVAYAQNNMGSQQRNMRSGSMNSNMDSNAEMMRRNQRDAGMMPSNGKMDRRSMRSGGMTGSGMRKGM